ncbi:MAG: FAD-dependent oxidoreductase [Nitrospirae bacterium]|nr:FAD-dependent oxidoreductase [Nitrospirota bacterium]
MGIKEFETKVMEIIQRTYNVKSFRFIIPEHIEFKPGQFLHVTIKIDSREASKHFTISNSPTENTYVEFTKKITESEFSHALDTLKVGDWARISLPYGTFTFCGEYEKTAFLVGGIGITPVRSICKFVCDKKIDTDIVILYGNKTERDIIFYEDFIQMEAENKKLRVVYILDSPLDRTMWKGKIGFITSEMIIEEIPDYDERVFYMCGPPKMVGYLRTLLLKEIGISEKKIIFENFSGY